MEKRNVQLEQEHAVRAEGIAFLRENPVFNQFIGLIRKGAIEL